MLTKKIKRKKTDAAAAAEGGKLGSDADRKIYSSNGSLISAKASSLKTGVAAYSEADMEKALALAAAGSAPGGGGGGQLIKVCFKGRRRRLKVLELDQTKASTRRTLVQ